MISEIYASGKDGVSAFMIVEKGVCIHYGSHMWSDCIAYEGVKDAITDLNCEIMAVLCGLMLCEKNGRFAVNIYTDNPQCREIYEDFTCESRFFSSYMRHVYRFDVLARPFSELLPTQYEFRDNLLNLLKR